jgi:hypothetical protein
VVGGIRVHCGLAALPQRRLLEEALLIGRLWTRRVWQRLGRSAPPLCQARGLDRPVCVPGAISAHSRPVRIACLEARALAGGRGTRPCCVVAGVGASSAAVCLGGRCVLGRALSLAEWCVSPRAERLLLLPRRAVVGVRHGGGWGSCRRRGERGHRGHGRRAREGGRLAGAARRVCSRRRAHAVAPLLYPQRPHGGRLWVAVARAHEEFLVRAALLAVLHGDGSALLLRLQCLIAGDDRR